MIQLPTLKLIIRLLGSSLLAGLAFLTLLALPVLAQSPPAWGEKEDLPELDSTTSLAWGDYDNDGDLDLAVGNYNQASRLYRNDKGMLTGPVHWSIPTRATKSLAWGDYDGDGDLDLVVGNYDQPSQLYQNNTVNGLTPSFSLTWTTPGTATTTSLAWGDYDNDGDLDLAMGNKDQKSRLFRNEGGNLSSTAVWSTSVKSATTSLAWGDYDNDGDLDLALGNEAQPNQVYRNDLVNSAIRTFNLAWTALETANTTSLAWGDYDNDGDLDLAVGNEVEPNQVYRNDLANDTTRTFNLAWTAPETTVTTSLAWGDQDGDGDLDLIVGNRGTVHQLYRNNTLAGGPPTFAIWPLSTSFETTSLAWGDYDNDGDLDLAAGTEGQGNHLYPNEEGLAKTGWVLPTTGLIKSLAWGDYDGDGDLDLATGNYGQPSQLYQNNTVNGLTPSFSLTWTTPGTATTTSLAWGDYDNDGDLDLAMGNKDQKSRLFRNEEGNLSSTAVWSTSVKSATTSLAWGDYDNDGDLDLALGNEAQPNQIYRNDLVDGATRTFNLAWTAPEVANTTSLAWGDYDNDGDLDLAVGNEAQPNRLYQNKGGTFMEPIQWPIAPRTTRSLAWGDYDGDGDLDLATGNYGQPSQVYGNENRSLTITPAWSSAEPGKTSSLAWGDYDGDDDLDLILGNEDQKIRLYYNDDELSKTFSWDSRTRISLTSLAWGDVDGDGDLDLAAGTKESSGSQLQIYLNRRRTAIELVNNPAYVVVSRPGKTKDAYFFSTSQILQPENGLILIPYRLFDSEGQPVPRIFPEFSPNGGGQWFPATPGPGGDGLTNLAASPEGASHTFAWRVEADLIKSDNVVFRIKAQPKYTHSPILWSALAGQSPPFRVSAPWYIKVVDEQGKPVNGAIVYSAGQKVGLTNQAGLLKTGALGPGTRLMALALQAEQAGTRLAHEGWAYRTYLTSPAFTVTKPGEQRLVVQRNRPLVLFNLVVSIEWNADKAYMTMISKSIELASAYLHDFTDGQMAFQQVKLYNNKQNWTEADIQISAKNIVHPHAYIGGIISPDKSQVIRIGRFWDGNSGNQGNWDQPDGFRTLAHEFGHYALHLYDEYFAYDFENGVLAGEREATCTGRRVPYAVNASVMDEQYISSELSVRGVDSLWSDACEDTAQMQFNKESAWETVARKYADTATPPRWQIVTPLSRGGVLTGPMALSPELPQWPQVKLHQTGPPAPPLPLTVRHPNGDRFAGAIVALYHKAGVMSQGLTDNRGELDIYGATIGDKVRVASLDGGLAGLVTVGSENRLEVSLSPVSGLGSQVMALKPHLRIVAGLNSASPEQIDLLVFLHNFGPGAKPQATLTEPAGQQKTLNLNYSSSNDIYTGKISLNATERGTGSISVLSEVGDLHSTYHLQQVFNDRRQDLYSSDGNLSLHVEAGSLPQPAAQAYLVVMPPGSVPGSLPVGFTLVGDPYDITASGALTGLAKPGILTLHYDKALINDAGLPSGLAIYHWDPDPDSDPDTMGGAWQKVTPITLNETHQAVIAPIKRLGTYALLAPSGPWNNPSADKIFLPLLMK